MENLCHVVPNIVLVFEKYSSWHKQIALIMVLGMVSAVHAQQTDMLANQNTMLNPVTPGLQQPADLESSHPLSFSGYLDVYYSANLNKPSSRNNLGNSGISRGFDRYAGQFQLGMLLMKVGYKKGACELVAEVGYGPNVEYGSYGNDFRYRWGTVLANTSYSAIMIKQAVINYKPTSKLTFALGQFGTHIGYEYIDAPLNFHYSINNTFNAGIPFYHLGLKATYTFNERVSLMTGVVNGTDNVNDNNRGKSFIGQLALVPAKGFSVYVNTIQGNEANARGNGLDTASYFGVIDLVTTYQLSEKFLIAAWLMLGTLKGEFQGGQYFTHVKHWGGANLYTTYTFSKCFALGTRLEYFDNTAGARSLLTNGKGTSVESITLTGNISLSDGNLLLKPEVRSDIFNRTGTSEDVQQFMDRQGAFTRNYQVTAALAAIFKF